MCPHCVPRAGTTARSPLALCSCWGGLPVRTAGSLALLLWNLSQAHVPTLTVVPGTQGPLPSCLASLVFLLILSDIRLSAEASSVVRVFVAGNS